MATLKVGEREIELAPYKLGDVETAAPFIDALNAEARAIKASEEPSMVEMTTMLRNLLSVLSIGTTKVDPELTADTMKNQYFSFGDLDMLRVIYGEVMEEAGFKSGEANAPLASEEPAGALSTNSEDSSTSLSPPA